MSYDMLVLTCSLGRNCRDHIFRHRNGTIKRLVGEETQSVIKSHGYRCTGKVRSTPHIPRPVTDIASQCTFHGCKNQVAQRLRGRPKRRCRTHRIPTR